MPTFDPYIGRREAVGIGIGTDVATAVAPQAWLRWLENDVQVKTEVIENESAMGLVEKINDSDVVGKWVEGNLGGKISDVGIGYLLLGWFGTVSTGAAVSGKYPHTFNVNQSSKPAPLTLARTSPAGGKRHPYLTIDTLEISAEKQGYVQFSSAVKARIGSTSTETLAFTDELEFTSKDIVVKTASSVAGLSGATAIDAISTKLTLERPSEAHFPLGGDDNPKFDRGEVEASGEIVVRYASTDFEDDHLNNVVKALGITMTNGTTSLAFTAGKVRFKELEKSIDLGDIVTETVSFSCQLDPTTSKTISAVLTNAKTGYAAA